MIHTKKDAKRVLILGINFSPELTGIGKYTGEMVNWLTDENYECTVVTSFPYYPYWKVQKPYTGKWYKKDVSRDGRLTVYRCPMYVPATPTGLKRIIHEATFCFSAFWAVLSLLFKPAADTVFCMAPPFHLGYLALFYRFFKGSKVVYHIHDMQIEAARDLEVIKAPSVFRLLFAMERYIINRADFITTVALGMRKKIMQKTTREVIYFPNWVDTDKFWPLAEDLSLKKQWGFNEQDKVVLYSGAIGEKQGLESLIDVADSLKSFSDIKFVICGTGPYKERLIQLADTRHLDNLTFMPLQEMDAFNAFLNMADVHLVIQKTSACDLMMPSKLTTILAVGGLALVTANPGTNLYEVVSEYEMGILIPSENDNALKDAILKSCTHNHEDLKSNGRRYAQQYLNRHGILGRIMTDVETRPVEHETFTAMPKLNETPV